MYFDKNSYTVEEITVGSETVRYRAWRDLPYAERPVVPEYQKLNLYAPEDYFEGRDISGYTIENAPVFMPNTVGGYMPGPADEPGEVPNHPGHPNTVFRALQHGYVVAAPAIRGRSQTGGQAPACIADYKAAVRWLRHFAEDLPGDQEKIITNGTSAGGALSALMGATGNHPDYSPYLEEIGAAEESDAVFAASCYCPITNLDHADMAYEWEFKEVFDYHRGGWPSFPAADGEMTELQKAASRRLAAAFPEYVNSLGLKDSTGTALTLDPDGNGSFKKYIEKVVLKSAQRAIDRGDDVSSDAWLTVDAGKAVSMDFAAYVRTITRMKTAPAFDDMTMKSPENNLFGTPRTPCRHFTAFGAANSLVGGETAPAGLVKVMNPMYYIADPHADSALYYRIRHGETDRDTSLAVSAILALKLQEQGIGVDYHSPWHVPHAGDYDIEDLFAWIDKICKKEH